MINDNTGGNTMVPRDPARADDRRDGRAKTPRRPRSPLLEFKMNSHYPLPVASNTKRKDAVEIILQGQWFACAMSEFAR